MAFRIGARKLKSRHLKKAAVVALYSVVIVVMVAGMVTPALM